MPESPKYKKSEIRCKLILDAALELFLAKGYEATSLSDIIELSGGSLSSVYKYFDNKESLFLRIIELQSKKLDERMNERMRINKDLTAGVCRDLSGVSFRSGGDKILSIDTFQRL